MACYIGALSMKSGMVIVINGASCAGKSTLATAIQNCAREPFIIVSLDQFRDSMPDRFRGLNSPERTAGAEGLNIVPIPHDGRMLTDIQFGTFGKSVLRGMRRAIRAMANEQLNVIVDDLIVNESFRDDYLQALKNLNVLFVGVHCSTKELVRREQMREGRFPGTAETTLAKVHSHMLYDIEVDTTHKLPLELAQRVLKCISKPSLPSAFDRMLTSKTESNEQIYKHDHDQ